MIGKVLRGVPRIWFADSGASQFLYTTLRKCAKFLDATFGYWYSKVVEKCGNNLEEVEHIYREVFAFAE